MLEWHAEKPVVSTLDSIVLAKVGRRDMLALGRP
jgi:hypothetical protein